MRRVKKKSHQRKKATFPLAIVAGLLPGVQRTITGFQSGGMKGGAQQAALVYLGYNYDTATWHPNMMWYGTAPLLLGLIVHRVASRLGVNRALAATGIPFVRL